MPTFLEELTNYKKTTIKIENLSIDDKNPANCRIFMKIGNSEFLEITGGKIKPACLPSMHS